MNKFELNLPEKQELVQIGYELADAAQWHSIYTEDIGLLIEKLEKLKTRVEDDPRFKYQR